MSRAKLWYRPRSLEHRKGFPLIHFAHFNKSNGRSSAGSKWVFGLTSTDPRREAGSETFFRFTRPMSALGQKQTSRSEIGMSALPPKADIAGQKLGCPLSAISGCEQVHQIAPIQSTSSLHQFSEDYYCER